MVVWLALRGLLSSRTFVWLVLAVALAAGFQVSNDANLDGFDLALLDDALGHGAGDVRVSPRDRLRFDDGDREAATLATQTGAVDAVPLLVFAGAVAGTARFLAAPICGVDPRARRPPFHLVEGRLLASGSDVLLGTALAARVGARIGAAVELRAILGPRDWLLDEPNTVALRATVRGLVSGGSGAYRAAFVDRAALANVTAARSAASTIALHLSDHGAARAVAARIEAIRPDLEARAWPDDDRGLTSYLDGRRAIGRISYVMVIAAIALPIWALLYIHVLRQQRELAILAALGFRRRELFAICIAQSVLVGAIGCALGGGLGYGLIRYFDGEPVFAWHSLVVRPAVTFATFAIPFGALLATAAIAALHPAARAARVEPAVALRRIE